MPTFDFRRHPAAVTFEAGDGDDLVIGSRFGDVVAGGAGDDRLLGRNGGDTLRGGAGADLTTGGKGSDTFVFVAGDLVASRLDTVDTVVSFQGAGTSGNGQQDLLRIEGFSANATLRFAGYDPSSETLQYYEVMDAATPGAGGFILVSVAGRTTRQLTAADVVFVPRVNNAPSGILLSEDTVAENAAAGTAVGVLIATDPDVGDAATFTLLDDAAGAFALASDGVTLVATQSFDFEAGPASYAVTVRATDRDGATYDEVLTVAVTNVDEDVVAGNDRYATAEDTALVVDAANGVLANDAAGDGGLTVVAGTFSTAPGGIVVLAADGSFTYTPSTDVTGADVFTYVARDADGDETTGTAVIVLAAVNDAPAFGAATYAFAIAENNAPGAAVGTAEAMDPDGAGPAYAIVENTDADAANDVPFAVGPGGAISATAALDFEAAAQFVFTLRAVDSGGLADTAAVTVQVGDVAERNLDFVTANYFNGSVSVRLGNGRGGSTGGGEVGVGDYPFSVALGDLDGDGDLDLAVANQFADSVSLQLGDGRGGFVDGGKVAVGFQPRQVTLGDLDRDGDLDLVTANLGGNSVSVRLGDGLGGFAGGGELGAGTGPFSTALGDLDGDGDLDLAIANTDGDSVSVRLGDGRGGFAGSGEVAVGDRPTSVALGDLDGDGDLDFVTANYDARKVSVRLGDGRGGFADGGEVGVGGGPVSLALGDLDGDGDLDLAVANLEDDTVSVLRGDGQGALTFVRRLTVGDAPRSVALGDIDGDGDLDIAAANQAGNSISVLLSNGQGSFANGGQVAVGNTPFSLVIGELDGPGGATAGGLPDLGPLVLNPADIWA